MSLFSSLVDRFDRFNPSPIFRGHRKGLSDYRTLQSVPDRLTRTVLWGLPAAVTLCVFSFGGTLTQPSALLSGLALLSGSLLAAFGQLSTLRLKAAESLGDNESDEGIFVDYFDETAAHLLVAAYSSAVTACIIVLGLNFGLDASGRLTGVWSAVVSGSAVYVFLLFIVALPRIYVAYAGINRIRDEMNGTFKNKPRN